MDVKNTHSVTKTEISVFGRQALDAERRRSPSLPSPCNNGRDFVFSCQILRPCAMYSFILHYFLPTLMLYSHLFVGLSFLFSLHMQIHQLLGGIPLPSRLTRGGTISVVFFLGNIDIGSMLAFLQKFLPSSIPLCIHLKLLNPPAS